MFISIALIHRYILSQYPCTVHGQLSEDLTLFSVEFATADTIPRPDRIYLLDLRKNEENLIVHDCAALAAIGKPDPALIDRCKCIIEFSDSESAEAVFNAINGAFVFYNQWDFNLQRVLKSHGTIQNLIDCSAQVFRNTIVVHNAAFECIAETNEVSEAEDYNTYLKNSEQRLSHDYQRTFLEDRVFQDSLSYQVPFFSAVTGHRTMAQNISINGEFYCRIVITDRKSPLDSADLKLLQHLSEYVQVLFSNCADNLAGELQSFSSFLSHVLDGKTKDESYINKIIREQGWRSGDYYLCLVFIKDSFSMLGNTSWVICKHLKKLITRAEVFRHNDNIVAVYNWSQAPANTADITSAFAEYMRDMNMKVGVSNVICGFNNLVSMYKQAELALKIGLRLWNDQWIQRFSSVAPYYIIEQSITELPAIAVCPTGIIDLLRRDALNNTDYYQTFKTFLENDMHIEKTAKRLFIHRTTLIYRLKKIKSIFLFDFDDPLLVMYYKFSINLISHTGIDLDVSPH